MRLVLSVTLFTTLFCLRDRHARAFARVKCQPMRILGAKTTRHTLSKFTEDENYDSHVKLVIQCHSLYKCLVIQKPNLQLLLDLSNYGQKLLYLNFQRFTSFLNLVQLGIFIISMAGACWCRIKFLGRTIKQSSGRPLLLLFPCSRS